jgi:hypothetical protein
MKEEASEAQRGSCQSDSRAANVQDELHAASQHAAAVEVRRHEQHLLMVHDVAELLTVPVS